MRRHPAASLVSLLAVSCIAAPIANDQAETDQISAGNYAWSANKDAWTEYLTAPSVDALVVDDELGWNITEGGWGCAVGLVQDGETIYLKGYGMASPWQPWSYQTIAPVGSVAKTITALSLRRLDAEIGGLSTSDTLDMHLPGSDFDDKTLLELLSHAPGATQDPNWDDDSITNCGGPCDADTTFQLSHPRIAFDQMDDAIVFPPEYAETGNYSNVGYTALGALIDDKTHDAAWLDPDERGYEAYTWHRVGRFEANDTYRGQMLTLALTHSWRVDEDDIPFYAHGYNYTTGLPADAWDSGAVAGKEGWEASSGGWVMSIGDLSRLIESFEKNDVVGYTSTLQMTSKVTDVLGGYGQGVAIEHAPAPIGEGGPFQDPPAPGEEPEDTDHLWWHGGDVGGHVAVWTYWPDLEEERGLDPFGVALICNKRDSNHAAMGQLLPVAKRIKDEYVANGGVTIWNDQEITGLATLEEVDDRDYLLDLTLATIVDPPSFYVPLDQLEERVWVSVDAEGTKAALAMVQGPDPNAPNADVTELGTWTFTPGKTIHAGVGADTSITVAGVGEIDLADVRLSTAFNKHGTALAGATLGATIDLRQMEQLADDGWAGMCSDLAAEASCKPCSDRVQACLDVTIGYLEGADQ